MRRAFLPAVLLLAALGLSGCGGEPMEPGVVALVNGRPVSLKTLEFVHGLKLYVQPGGEGEELKRLRSEYGQALAVLVVESLVAQELEKRGLEPGEADVLRAETALRDGYPGNAFEQTMAEEGVEPAIWRERLRARLAMDTLIAQVLRPRVVITPIEVQAYYKEHSREFAQPAAVKFLRIESKNAESLKKALDAAAKAKDPVDLLTVFDDVSIQAQAGTVESLPRKWRDTLAVLKPGQSGSVGAGGAGFQALLLLERSEPRVEGVAQVYPLVEKRLAEAKLAAEFSAWLEKALSGAALQISPALVPEKGGG